jgi:hypothetical protein
VKLDVSTGRVQLIVQAMERLEIVELFYLLTKANGTPPSINMLAKEAKVSWRVANKVVAEYIQDPVGRSNGDSRNEALLPGNQHFQQRG